jgi:ferredoxin
MQNSFEDVMNFLFIYLFIVPVCMGEGSCSVCHIAHVEVKG